MPRMLLWPYPLTALFMGLGYLLAGPERVSAATFDAAKHFATISTWGLMFLIGFFALSVAIFSGSEGWVARTLFVGGAIYFLWGSLFLMAAIFIDGASLNAWSIYYLGATAHWTACWRVTTEGIRR